MNANRQQSEAWNGAEAVHWVDHADRYDRQLAPFADALLERVQLEPRHAVLDVGCGCGATTLTAARRAGAALGVDISEPLLEIATDRARAASVDNAEFVMADAQTYAFAEGAFDVAISQFGLMFFDDPVSAFSNLRRALVPGGSAAFVCWQGLEANEWVSIVGRRGRATRHPSRARRASPRAGHVRAREPRRERGAARCGGVHEDRDRSDLADRSPRRRWNPRRVGRFPAWVWASLGGCSAGSRPTLATRRSRRFATHLRSATSRVPECGSGPAPGWSPHTTD